MPKSFEQPPLKDLAALQELTKKRRVLIEQAQTGAQSPEEADAALSEAEALLPEIQRQRAAIQEKLWPFAELSKERLTECYEEQISAFEKARVFEQLKSGERGITDIRGTEQAFPSLLEVVARLKEKRAIVEAKARQGLTRTQVTPVGMPLDTLRERYRTRIREHYADKPDPQDPTKRISDPARTKLFAAKEKPTDPDVPLELDTNEPLWTYDEYVGGDVNGKLVYFPTQFDQQNHGGKTKAEVIAQVGAWQIILTEDNPILPAQNQGKDIGGRKQLEAGKSSVDYLGELTTNPMYQHESGFLTEDWLTLAIIRLETTNQVLDDWQGKGKISRNIGQYFPASGRVPDANWRRDDRQALLGGDVPARAADHIAVRSAVRV